MQKTIYCIPGLSNDHRVFSWLNLPGYRIKYLDFIEPLKKNERIQNYCRRLLEHIDEEDLSTPPILLGFSLGGIVAIELSKLMNTEKIIIVNSIKSSKERPIHLRLLESLPLYRLTPTSFIKPVMLPLIPLFGFVPIEQREVYIDMWNKFPDKTFRWGAQMVLTWEHTDPVENLIHIHGDKDLMFPIGNIKDPIVVKGGNHIMISILAEEVSALICACLEEKKVAG
ncbi:alpha/beta hydrolase [Algivirga pacifica]|uniref:Alpha/beta hydrolase n=1 Tax=Algivirga pacifica TaxID=1162670 RepID=A0ABP9DNQ8_9BACT